MSNVVMIPSVPRIPRRGAAYGNPLYVAPYLGQWAAWLRTTRGFVLIEHSPIRQSAIDDARRCAAARGFEVVIRDAPLPIEAAGGGTYEVAAPELRHDVGGEIFVAPCDQDGGAWGVFHEALDGSQRLTTWRMTLDRAVAAARREARALGATFDEGDDTGGTAA